MVNLYQNDAGVWLVRLSCVALAPTNSGRSATRSKARTASTRTSLGIGFSPTPSTTSAKAAPAGSASGPSHPSTLRAATRTPVVRRESRRTTTSAATASEAASWPQSCNPSIASSVNSSFWAPVAATAWIRAPTVGKGACGPKARSVVMAARRTGRAGSSAAPMAAPCATK